MPDTVAPTAAGTNPSVPANGAVDVSTGANLIITFSESMNPSTVTTNTCDTSCSGTVQVSKDNFSTCVRISDPPSASNGNITFTVDPAGSLDKGQEYKVRITTGVEDKFGNTLSVQIVISFRTTS